MTDIDIDLNPVTHITIDAIGKPGERTFFLQGRKDDRVVTLLIEKIQIQMLILGLEQFMTELKQKFPDLEEADATYDENSMRISPPIDPLFRVGELSLGYDVDHDRLVLIARQDESSLEGQEKPGVVHYWCTRSQMLALASWAVELAGRGRPVWPSSGEPIAKDNEFSPKNNGHKH